MKSVFVLDSSALLNNERFSFLEGESYVMTSMCFAELKSFSQRLLAENAVKAGMLSIRDPSPKSLEKASVLLRRIGDRKLSEADKSMVALAVEMNGAGEKFSVVSDDFSVQNACRHLGVWCEGGVQGSIKRKKSWHK